MSLISRSSGFLVPLALLAVPASGLLAQEQQGWSDGDVLTTVYGAVPDDLSDLPAGPEVEGFISQRKGNKVQVTDAGGSSTAITVGEATEIRSSGGFLGLNRSKLGEESLLNGLPVTVRTVEWGGGLVASRIDLKSRDLKTAAMIQSGTAQGFAEQTAATEALRGRVADIDQYNVKSTTNVNFDTGKAVLSAQAKNDLCAAATSAQATDNALLLVVGYTDSTGTPEINQALSEKRASTVVNHLQQACGWAPYRMLTPTGMSEADPVASNETIEGKALNRRVAVNVLVSKAVDGI